MVHTPHIVATDEPLHCMLTQYYIKIWLKLKTLSNNTKIGNRLLIKLNYFIVWLKEWEITFGLIWMEKLIRNIHGVIRRQDIEGLLYVLRYPFQVLSA